MLHGIIILLTGKYNPVLGTFRGAIGHLSSMHLMDDFM
jgi:hypothetical protein